MAWLFCTALIVFVLRKKTLRTINSWIWRKKTSYLLFSFPIHTTQPNSWKLGTTNACAFEFSVCKTCIVLYSEGSHRKVTRLKYVQQACFFWVVVLGMMLQWVFRGHSWLNGWSEKFSGGSLLRELGASWHFFISQCIFILFGFRGKNFKMPEK